jgi:peptide/nickel transport system permease protein
MSTTIRPISETGGTPSTTRRTSLWRDTLRGVLQQRSAVVGLTILGFLITVAVFADFIAPFGYDEVLLGVEEGVERRSPPCIHALGCPVDQPQHIMGTDGNFRDLFSRVVYGARVSLLIGFVTVGVAIIIGSLLGATAGFAGGSVDNLIMRIMDLFMVFPALLLAIAIVTLLGGGLVNALLAVAIVSIPIYARIMRSTVLTVRGSDYVTASRALGESSRNLLLRRIMPNSLTPIIVAGTLGIASAILEVAALSFLGIGAQPPVAEWGSMIGLERSVLFSAPHIIFFPAVALALTVFGFNLFGDGLRDALDPRLNR